MKSPALICVPGNPPHATKKLVLATFYLPREVQVMRITVRLLLVLAAVMLIAITLSERPQSATANTGSARAKSDFCNSVVAPSRRSGPTTTAAGLLSFTGEPAIAGSLPWDSLFHSHAVASGSGLGPTGESFNSSAPVISGLPAESAPPAF